MWSLRRCNEKVFEAGFIGACRSSFDPDRFVVDGWLRFFHEFLFCSVAGEVRLARSLLYWVNTNRVWGCVLFGVGEYLAMCRLQGNDEALIDKTLEPVGQV